jgi:hypothetical protein
VDTEAVNDPATTTVEPGRIRSGSAIDRTRALAEEPEPNVTRGTPPNRVDGDAERSGRTGLFDWVPTTETANAPGANYPVERGVPHPHWVPEPAQHPLAGHAVVVDESATVVRVLVALAVLAFLLGLTVFYPVSPLGP